MNTTYQGGNGRRYVVLINKGASNLLASIKQDGVTQGNANTNKFLETFVTGSDPSLINSNPPPNNVEIQTLTGGNPVTVPPYSVMRLEWQIFNVPPPLLTLNVSNATPILHWSAAAVSRNRRAAGRGRRIDLGRAIESAIGHSFSRCLA